MTTLRLKSLELNGYKTFADKTLFEFAGPVTAVVGPNGSGKSNIADALRWVLGEQSYGVLRGRKTEDMIFSGSEKRSQSGMASVNITFDNSEGWLPIDFAEVSVTRRAYRDGQNEYLVNQQKVRLKDVSELLSHSALSERTYTIIGQGLVDSALTLKSDERRRLFEEAAGIGLYRARKEQSLRRLELTLRNLERVEDILAELKPRVRTLEKQAQRAEEFTSLRSELRETLRQWYGYHWHRAQADLGAFRQEADSREQNLGLARQKQVELGKELNELRARTQSLRVQLNEWHRKLAELHASREGATKTLAVADERQRALTERREALAEEKLRLETDLTSLTARLQEAEQDAKRYEVETQEAQAKLDEVKAVLAARQAVEEEYQGKTLAYRDRLTQLEREQGATEAKQEQMRARLEKVANELTELQRNITSIEGEAAQLQTQISVSEKAVEQAESELANAKDREQEIAAQIENAQTEQNEVQKKLQHLLTTRARLQAELKGIEDAEQASAGFAHGARLLLEAAKQRRLGLGKGTLGREIRVPNELETAISAALGAYLDAIVVEEQGDSDAALEVLAAEQASATLLPLQSLQLDGRLETGNIEGLVGVAADLVEVSDALRPAVQLLLGRTLVATDRAAARKLLSSQNGAMQVVTLRGEVFHRTGQIEVRSPKLATGLARPREERELRAQLKETDQLIAEAEEKLTGIGQQAVDLETNRKKTQLDVSSATQKLDQIQRDAHSHKLASDQLERQLDWFRAQGRTLDAERANLGEQIDSSASSQQALALQIVEAQMALDEHLQSSIESPMDEQHAQAAHWEMRLAVSQRAQQEAQRRIAERQQALERTEAQLVAQQERNAELEANVVAIQSEKATVGDQQGTVAKDIEAIQAQISPAETDLAAAEALLDRQQLAESQALQALSAAERAHTQAQIALGRQQEALEGLRTRIEDDFGLVAFQYETGVSGPTPLPLGELVEQLPVIELLPPDLEEVLKQQRNQIRRLGSVNPEAQQEYLQVKERVQNMEEQVHDLRAAEADLKKVITELDALMEKEFRTTFDRVAAEFREIFSRLFNGGSAKLLLTEEQDLATTGIDIEARLPGKRSQRLALLSGGERSLTAAALVFSLLKASPTPFCVMDEVDAMLDEANVGRFTDLLRELSKSTQFVVITHNRNTVQVADVIYGITMGRDTASQVISLKLDEVGEKYTA